jgi:hypothetical protein
MKPNQPYDGCDPPSLASGETGQPAQGIEVEEAIMALFPRLSHGL